MGVYDVTQIDKIAQTIKDLGRKSNCSSWRKRNG